MKILMKWGINAITLMAVVHIVGGIRVSGWGGVIVAALVLGLLNAFLRPIILLLTLPVNVLTLGIFTLVVNGFMFYLAAALVKGFEVSGFWSAFWGAFIFSIISFILNLIFIHD